jgi:hypothetical protein
LKDEFLKNVMLILKVPSIWMVKYFEMA